MSYIINPFGIAPTGTWQTAFSNTLDNTLSAGWNGWTLKSQIPSAQVSLSGSKCRLTFTPPTSGESSQFASCVIGNNGNTATVLVSGSGTILLTAGGSAVVSDDINMAINNSQAVWIAFGNFNDASKDQINTDSSITGCTYFYSHTNDDTANPTNTSGYVTVSNAIAIVSKLEVFG